MQSNPLSSPIPPVHIATLFDQWASTDRAQKMALGHQPLIDALLAELFQPDESRGALLDLGCGTGAFLAQAEPGFKDICGIDASPKMIEVAQRNAPTAELKVGNFAQLPWPSLTFSHVTTIEALYYCDEPRAALTEVVRVLRANGRFDLIIDYYQDSPGTASWPQGLGFEIMCLSAQEWTDLAAQAGLRNLKTRRIVRSQSASLPSDWEPSVWFPTQESYLAYLRDGALWITGYTLDN